MRSDGHPEGSRRHATYEPNDDRKTVTEPPGNGTTSARRNLHRRPEQRDAARQVSGRSPVPSYEEATKHGPRTTWFRRLSRTIADLSGNRRTADDTDRLFLVWDDWHREAGARLNNALTEGRTQLTGSHDQQCASLTVLARLAGTGSERPPKTEQSATDCRWTWSTYRRSERRVWEVKTSRSDQVARSDVKQLLGQIEVETKRFTKTRVYGCLLTPGTRASGDAAEAARDKIALINQLAAVRLYDVLADRLRQYTALCGNGNAQDRGEARTKIEQLLPEDGWLGRLLAPTQGRVIGVDDIEKVFPP